MKKYIYLFLALVTSLSYSQITFRGCTSDFGNQDYVFTNTGTDASGHNIYETTPLTNDQSCPGWDFCEFKIYWNSGNSRWEFVIDDGSGNFSNPFLYYYNTSNSKPNPPSLSLGTWVDTGQGVCNGNLTSGNTTLTGSVQSTLCSPPTATSVSTNVSCNGGSNGRATVTPSGGSTPYTYSWSPSGGTAATATGLSAGSYTCTITDAGGCQTTKSVVITQPTAITATTSLTNVSCNGGSNGTATVSPSSGTPSYTYSWSPSGGTAATATGLSAGSYTCTITDSNACTLQKSFTITQPTAISATTSQTNVSCNGGSNGTATVSPSGGTTGYTYSWSPSGGTAATATGLSAGNYTCTITDANACTLQKSFTITQPTAITFSGVSQTNVSCNGGSNGAASVSSASGGVGGYTYNWTPGNPTGDGTTSVTGLTAGTWTCTVTDANGCTKATNFTITQPTAITATTITTNVSCNGASNGSAAVTPSGGSSGYTYSWSPSGGTAATATGLSAGSYSCTITDANGCSLVKNITITQPAAIAATTSLTNVSCNGGSNGTATVSPSGGTPSYTYSWSPSGGTAATATGLSAGSYTCTITDSNACTLVKNITITQPTAIAATTSATNVSCNGGSNGTATVTPSGGTTGYTYSWSPSGGTAATATGLSAGSYTCTITDANGCTLQKNIIVTQPAAFTFSGGSQTNIACNGASNGAASVNVASGGAGSFTYDWTPGTPTGDGTTSVSGLTAGAWTCTATDANGCTKSINFTLTQPTAMTATTTTTNVSCNGGSNGRATVSPSGGTSGYTYSWSPSGGTASIASGLSAGSYTCTITDANGCTLQKSFTITQPTAIAATTSLTNVSCNGGSNGTATVSPSGGTPSYTYSWSPSGGTAATATGLAVGNYTCTITDTNACTSVKNITITQPTAIAATTSATNVSCNGGSNGTATVTPSGGTAPFTYSWSPSGGTAATATGLSSGSYTCTITDANGCTLQKNITVTQPAAFSATASQTNVSCFGGSNGTASVTPSGGTTPYSYSWSNGETYSNTSRLAVGPISCTITDANSCTVTKNFTITQPTQITATTAQTNLACYGASNGSATVTASGGTGPYTYSWYITGGNAATATNLYAGSYTCTITDANSCFIFKNFTLTEPSAFVFSAASQTNVSCNGGSNGAASVNAASGGAGSFTYDWSPGNPTGDGTTSVTGLTAGTWTCTATDANGCNRSIIFTITEPTTLSATSSQTNLSCKGDSTGSASVIASGGTAPYSYSWSPNGGTLATANQLAAGTYSCTITDANSCSVNKNFTITEPTQLSANASQTNLACFGASNGSASVTVSGGTAPYTYSWSNGETTATASGLIAGNYTCTITDANSCTLTKNFTITQPAAIAISTSQTNISCNGGSNGSATVIASGGTAPFTYSWSPNGGTLATANGLTAGDYKCTITDANACIVEENFTLTQPDSLITVESQTNVSCNGGSNGSAIVTPSGGTAPYSYSWSNGGTSEKADNLAAGTYSCTITDANACNIVENFTLTEPVILTASTSKTDLICNSGTSGVASVIASGGTTPYSYSWSNGASSATINNLTAGNYSCTITDANACSIIKTFAIAEPTALRFITQSLPSYDYNGLYSQNIEVEGGTGVKSIVVSSGNLPSGFSLSTSGKLNGTSSQVANSNFTIAVSDENGCSIMQDFILKLKQIPITVTVNASQTKVYGTTEPELKYSVSPNLLTGDSFSGKLTRETGENVGEYQINQGTLSAGDNYLITFVPAKFSITKANQTINWKQELGIGCNADLSPTLTAVSSSGLPVSYTSSNTDIVEVSNGLIVSHNYGSTTITATQAGNANYNPATAVVLPVVVSQPNLIRKHFDDVLFFDNSLSNFVSFSWYKNGELIPNQNAQYCKDNGNLNGTYYAIATKSDGTKINSCPITVSPTVEAEYIKISPNPVKPNASFELITNISASKMQNAQVELFNIGGLLIKKTTTSDTKIPLDAPMTEGIYIIKLTLSNGTYFTKNLLINN